MPTLTPTPDRLSLRLVHPHDPVPSAEDIFASALETLFPEDTQQSHGTPGQSIIYRSPRFGDVYLRIPAHPDEEGGRTLFAHYLWNAGVICAEGIERGSEGGHGDDAVIESDGRIGGEVDRGRSGEEEGRVVRWDKRFWDLRGLDVLELGAATALPSLIAILSNARTVVSTDHPSSTAITTDAIETNIQINVVNRGRTSDKTTDANANVNTDRASQADRNSNGHGTAQEREYTDQKMPTLNHPPVTTSTSISVYGYTWGTETFYATGGFGKAAPQQPMPWSFDRIIVADCLWMPMQHGNLVRSILRYLKDATVKCGSVVEDGSDVTVPCALVVAGFHTGRDVVGDFIELATGYRSGNREGVIEEVGLRDGVDVDGYADVKGRLKAAEIFEVDVHGLRRDWKPVRSHESKEQLKRWCVCAILVKREQV